MHILILHTCVHRYKQIRISNANIQMIMPYFILEVLGAVEMGYEGLMCPSFNNIFKYV